MDFLIDLDRALDDLEKQENEGNFSNFFKPELTQTIIKIF